MYAHNAYKTMRSTGEGGFLFFLFFQKQLSALSSSGLVWGFMSGREPAIYDRHLAASDAAFFSTGFTVKRIGS